jgi:hypothetical protein
MEFKFFLFMYIYVHTSLKKRHCLFLNYNNHRLSSFPIVIYLFPESTHYLTIFFFSRSCVVIFHEEYFICAGYFV